MNTKARQLAVFGLNSSEQKTLSFLIEQQKVSKKSRISDISRETSLPRTTCADAVQKLTKRGLILKKIHIKEKYYEVSNLDGILNSVRSVFSSAENSSEEDARTIDGQIVIYSGLANCHAVWKKVANLNKGERFICVQPNLSLTETFKKLGIDCLYPNNDALNNKGIITEGIINESCFKLIYEVLSEHKDESFARVELDKMSRRPSDLTLINDSYLNLATELLFMHDIAYLVNWRDQVAIEIQNPTIRDFLKELYTLARGYGRKVNQHETIQNFLNGLEKEKGALV